MVSIFVSLSKTCPFVDKNFLISTKAFIMFILTLIDMLFLSKPENIAVPYFLNTYGKYSQCCPLPLFFKVSICDLKCFKFEATICYFKFSTSKVYTAK